MVAATVISTTSENDGRAAETIPIEAWWSGSTGDLGSGGGSAGDRALNPSSWMNSCLFGFLFWIGSMPSA